MNNPQKRSMITGYAGLPFGEISQCEAGEVSGFWASQAKSIAGREWEPHWHRMRYARWPGSLRIALPAAGRDLGNLEPVGGLVRRY